MRLLLWMIITILTMVNLVQPANILMISPVVVYSQSFNFQPVLKTLASRGHNITVVSPFPQKTPMPNITVILVPNYMQEFLASMPQDNLLLLNTLSFQLTGLWNLGLYGSHRALQDENIQRLIKDNNSKYDLIIIQTWFLNEPFVAFGHKFNAPIINLMPTSIVPPCGHFTGNHYSLSYVPVVRPGFTDRMTFLERVQNTFLYYWEIIIGEVYYLRKQEALMRKYFKYPGSENLPSLTDMLRNTSLTLTDFHEALDYPRPLHKNIIFYGGINLNKVNKLPADLQTFMDEAEDGVIYFSFGSLTTLSNLRPHMQTAIISALGKVKQKVLMRLDDPVLLKKLSKNIATRPWFPQPSILAHPNCKLFITHGGIHGTMEGLYHAVPLIGIPVFGDQNFNTLIIQSTGIGQRLEVDDITEETVLSTINTVLNDPKYRENIKERSAIFKDQPISTMDNVIYWIEYVIRHKGAPHLRPAVLDLHWYQYLMLDVIVFYLLIIFLIVYIVFKIMKLFCLCVLWLFNLRNSYKNDTKSKKE